MTEQTRAAGAPPVRPMRGPAILLGLGFGGFVDGIVLHQILQWHHMVSHTDENPTDTVAGLEANMLADGLFHVAAWVFAALGSLLLVVAWRRGQVAPTWRFHLGLVLAGWGIFNVVEGLVNHHILEIHHVRDDLGAPLSWDIGFLVVGVLMVVGGWALHRWGARD